MKENKVEKRIKDKADFATVDKVLDKKTIAILEKLQKREKLFDLSGCVSSGKEANVYTANCSTSLVSKFIQKDSIETEDVIPVVLKIYKTSTMLFKDRDRYIIDEKRFTNFCTSNSRKLVKVWAEKEVRNLKRIERSGIPCPRPLYLKRSVLVMSMIGDETPGPRLKDADVEDWSVVYAECLGLLDDLYNKAGLVHADFSEYNLIYHKGKTYVIDVGQSIAKDQENSKMFLVMDIRNCNDFFARKKVAVKTEVEIFESITGLKVPSYLGTDGRLDRNSFIPSRFSEVANPEDIALFIGENKEALDELSDEFLETSSDLSSSVLSEQVDDEEAMGDKKMEEKEELIDVYLRKLKLVNPQVTEAEEKEYNKKRKQIVKEMNRERRIARVERDNVRQKEQAKKTRKKIKKVV